jgi:hypothetical protein
VEALAAVLVLFAAAGAIWVLVEVSRDSQRWPWLFRERTWLRVLAWAAVLTAAAILGAVLGGSPEVVAGSIAVGGCVAYAALHFWADGYEEEQ